MYRLTFRTHSNENNTYGIYAGSTTASSAPFRVTRAGKLYSTDAEISGNITANSLTLGSGVTIDSDDISGLSDVATSGDYNDLINKPSSQDLSLYVQKDGTIGTLPASGATSSSSTGFKVSTSGLLQASNAVIYGTVYASAGVIGGWNINTSYNKALTNGTIGQAGSIGLFPSGNSVSLTIGGQTWSDWRILVADKFGVDSVGNVALNNSLYASGTINSSGSINASGDLNVSGNLNLNGTVNYTGTNITGLVASVEASNEGNGHGIWMYKYDKVVVVRITESAGSNFGIGIDGWLSNLSSTERAKWKPSRETWSTAIVRYNSKFYPATILISPNGTAQGWFYPDDESGLNNHSHYSVADYATAIYGEIVWIKT